MSLPDIWKKICEKFDDHQDAILEIKNELNLIHQIDNENQTLNLKKEKDIVEFKNEQSSTPVEELMEPELEKDLNFDNDDLNNDRDKDDGIEFKRRFDQVIGRFFDPYEYLDLRKLKLRSWNREVLTNDWDERLSDHNINGALSHLDCVEELKKLKMNRNLVTGGDVHAFADVKFHFPNKVTIWSDSMMNLHRHGSSFKNLELADRSRIIDSNYCLKNFKFVVDANCFDFKDSNLFKTHRISSLSTKDFEFADQVEDFVEKLLPIGNTAIYRWNLIFKLAQHGHDVDKIKLPIIIDDIIEIKTRDPNYCPIWIPKNSSLLLPLGNTSMKRMILIYRFYRNRKKMIYDNEIFSKLDNRKFEWIFFPPGAFVIAYGRQQPTNVDVLETNGIWPIRLKVFRFKFKKNCHNNNNNNNNGTSSINGSSQTTTNTTINSTTLLSSSDMSSSTTTTSNNQNNHNNQNNNIFAGPLLSTTNNNNVNGMMINNKHVTWRPETPPSPNIYTQYTNIGYMPITPIDSIDSYQLISSTVGTSNNSNTHIPMSYTLSGLNNNNSGGGGGDCYETTFMDQQQQQQHPNHNYNHHSVPQQQQQQHSPYGVIVSDNNVVGVGNTMTNIPMSSSSYLSQQQQQQHNQLLSSLQNNNPYGIHTSTTATAIVTPQQQQQSCHVYGSTLPRRVRVIPNNNNNNNGGVGMGITTPLGIIPDVTQ
ncbi:hypothetical protein DERP_002781 [Dermatophagoides pteronyssinus]|uniref:Uncharacterized protein n=1 Tax=Dermatophagoides pteronyssinus TaxID=6956 RepID=A0ABQ8JVV5_DERPT|nr:hypothetical protein DERP_002781 [Dermatophagoides pteronyssinus]